MIRRDYRPRSRIWRGWRAFGPGVPHGAIAPIIRSSISCATKR